MNDIIKKIVKEKQELESKIFNLKAFIDSLDYPIHETTSEELQYIGAMIEQLRVMEQYSEILTKRISLLNNNDMSYFKERERIE